MENFMKWLNLIKQEECGGGNHIFLRKKLFKRDTGSVINFAVTTDLVDFKSYLSENTNPLVREAFDKKTLSSVRVVGSSIGRYI